MSVSAVRVRDLWKRYRLGVTGLGSGSLYEAVSERLRHPFRGRRPPSSTELWALREVEFELSAGEVLGIVGRNGSGKSTLLKVLSRITPPTRGRVEFRGRVASLLEVGTGFHPELTGRENIFLNGAILGMKRAEIRRRFEEIVAFAGIERFLDTPVKRYSSGMYVRLAFAVAAHLEPDILLVDEVLAVGDAEFQQRCLAKMGEVRAAGRTVLFVSHNLSAVRSLCTSALLLDQGQVGARGPVAEVLERYLGGSGHPAEMTWPDAGEAPGGDRVRLRAVRVRSEGQLVSEVPIDRPIEVEVDLELLEAGQEELCLNLYIKDLLGTVVLSTANTSAASRPADAWFRQRHAPGLYRARCTFPANFFNDLSYRISVYAVTLSPFQIEAAAEEVVDFHVRDTGALREPGRGGEWHGLVRVPLAWRTEPLGPAGEPGAPRKPAGPARSSV